MGRIKLTNLLVVLLLCLVAQPGSAQDEIARNLFSRYKPAILQIRIIDLTSGSKSAIGSGFLVDAQGMVATNYHVVQQAVSKPQQYRIEYYSSEGASGDLQLVDIDVINDLALVRASSLEATPTPLADYEPEIGSSVYSIGNPLDLGLTVVPGTYNGINQSNYYPRVLFTGSLNPGMSGGPTFDESGSVVGVNVSTAGNQISFLVPVVALQKLITESRSRDHSIADFNKRIGEQLFLDQQLKYSWLLADSWRTIGLGEAEVLEELPPFVKCWGGSNSETQSMQHLVADRSCRSEDTIYLSNQFSSGTLEYQFFWLEAGDLNSWQFYTMYQTLYSDFAPGNRAAKEDVGDFACDHSFIRDQTGRKSKVVFCTRAYRDHPQLYDLLYLQGSVDDRRKAFISHFTLSGVSRDNGLAFTRKFIGAVKWQ